MNGNIRKQHLFGKDTGDRHSHVISLNEDCIVYRIQNDTGELYIREYSIFPGIWLCYKDVYAQKFEYPASYPAGMLEITHCLEGRFEYDAGNQFFYLAPGDMSISRSVGKTVSVACPTQHYRGITVLIDTAQAPRCLSCFLDDVEVQPSMLLQKFCKDGQYFIMRSTPRLEHVFSELYAVPGELQKGYSKVKILELLLFLSALDPGLTQTPKHSCTKAHAELAKNVCRFICAHMDTHVTIEMLAEQFYISPAQLKKCFYSVYGESVYAYLRSYKLHLAAQCLKTTDKSVAEIAGAFGYENSSKFSKAFRDVMGVTPTGYRKNRTEQTG